MDGVSEEEEREAHPHRNRVRLSPLHPHLSLESVATHKIEIHRSRENQIYLSTEMTYTCVVEGLNGTAAQGGDWKQSEREGRWEELQCGLHL